MNRVGPINGVVIANELLDNLPFRLAVFDGGWREVVVSIGRDSDFVESTVQAVDDVELAPNRGRLTARGYPIQDQAAGWVSTAQGLLRQGSVKVFDYCTTTTAELAGRPWREWLRTYRSHMRGEHYLRLPGEQDITAQVCIDQLPVPSRIEDQTSFLRRFGIDQLVDDGRRAWSAAAARPDLAALSMRSRVQRSRGAAGAPWPWGVSCGHLAGGRRLSRIGVMAAQGGSHMVSLTCRRGLRHERRPQHHRRPDAGEPQVPTIGRVQAPGSGGRHLVVRRGHRGLSGLLGPTSRRSTDLEHRLADDL